MDVSNCYTPRGDRPLSSDLDAVISSDLQVDLSADVEVVGEGLSDIITSKWETILQGVTDKLSGLAATLSSWADENETETAVLGPLVVCNDSQKSTASSIKAANAAANIAVQNKISTTSVKRINKIVSDPIEKQKFEQEISALASQTAIYTINTRLAPSTDEYDTQLNLCSTTYNIAA